jgi:hypothetical protein
VLLAELARASTRCLRNGGEHRLDVFELERLTDRWSRDLRETPDPENARIRDGKRATGQKRHGGLDFAVSDAREEVRDEASFLETAPRRLEAAAQDPEVSESSHLPIV